MHIGYIRVFSNFGYGSGTRTLGNQAKTSTRNRISV
ncbi:Uncharacterised protein [Enterococcus faecium]|nr:Uncharacterised protein [Enterococcus faecium]SMJ87777.1 Uncharacterised protein [Enterococcus faecium]SMK30509.1 Uncharacterised protein [Enterococcus faecium]SMK32450.1 Uncharacterised protein [Enterococcus faecium]SMK40266.1 Uncharacterised protein [Enterococcus faecium]